LVDKELGKYEAPRVYARGFFAVDKAKKGTVFVPFFYEDCFLGVIGL
jgi:hypothetical protein